MGLAERVAMKDIHARTPVDRVAARVVVGGESYEPVFNGGNDHDSDLPIATAPVPTGVRDLTGTKFGKLTVIGYHSKKGYAGNRKSKHVRRKWVVRCVCGMYSVRRQKAIINSQVDGEDACDKCRHFESVKWKYANQP